jgi:hypothetical protein
LSEKEQSKIIEITISKLGGLKKWVLLKK